MCMCMCMCMCLCLCLCLCVCERGVWVCVCVCVCVSVCISMNGCVYMSLCGLCRWVCTCECVHKHKHVCGGLACMFVCVCVCVCVCECVCVAPLFLSLSPPLLGFRCISLNPSCCLFCCFSVAFLSFPDVPFPFPPPSLFLHVPLLSSFPPSLVSLTHHRSSLPLLCSQARRGVRCA